MRYLLKASIKGVVASLAISIAILCLLSIIMLFIDIPDILLSVISYAILSFIGYTSAYISTQIKRTKGLYQGLICSALIILIALIIHLLINGSLFSPYLIKKIAVIIVSAIIGAIKGINTKKTNRT